MVVAKQNRKVKIMFLLFVIVASCDLVGVIFDFELLRFVFKPLIMITLLLLYLVSKDRFNNWYIGAVLFSFFGDVLLLFEDELYFMLGLISFLIAHIIYIKIVLGWLVRPTLKTIVIATIPFVIVFSALINLLKSNLNDLFVPVVIYAIAISIMGIVSLLYYLDSRNVSSLFMVVGAILFIVSDAVLAINKFNTTNKLFPIVIMLTYITAQYCIYKAVIARKKPKIAVPF